MGGMGWDGRKEGNCMGGKVGTFVSMYISYMCIFLMTKGTYGDGYIIEMRKSVASDVINVCALKSAVYLIGCRCCR